MVKLVGILNVTPDSFSDGGKFFNLNKAVKQAKQLFSDGATIVDVGAESTRPNALQLTQEQEWARLSEVLSVLIPGHKGKVSLDSRNPSTIRQAFKIGPVIVNDVTSMNNPEMIEAVVELSATCIISHLPGMDIQSAHKLMTVKSVQEVVDDLLSREKMLLDRGIPKNSIILDPGIGFGKPPELNWQLLEFAKYVPGHSVMIGYSKKRFLGDHRMDLQPNLEAAKIAITAGADYLRVHDVAGHKKFLELA